VRLNENGCNLFHRSGVVLLRALLLRLRRITVVSGLGARKKFLRSQGIVLPGLMVILLSFLVTPALADKLLDAIFSFSHAPPPVIPMPQSRADPWSGLRQAPDETAAVAYCVRLCDGYYFPLPRSAGAPRSTPAKLCSSLCPAAETRIYSGVSGTIERAVASNGRRYSDLDKAFVYRERLVPDCACTKTGTGTATLDAETDPTLREGDIVVTENGPVVFKGATRWPFKSTDFAPAKNYSGLPTEFRLKLSALRVAPASRPASGSSASLGYEFVSRSGGLLLQGAYTAVAQDTGGAESKFTKQTTNPWASTGVYRQLRNVYADDVDKAKGPEGSRIK
jgi:hypothetical protein